jgi:hypothetical protein
MCSNKLHFLKWHQQSSKNRSVVLFIWYCGLFVSKTMADLEDKLVVLMDTAPHKNK